MPGSDFPVDATVLPLTEGQLDFETSLASGGTLGSLPLYVTGWLGYRLRSENQEAARKPGDEGYEAAVDDVTRSSADAVKALINLASDVRVELHAMLTPEQRERSAQMKAELRQELLDLIIAFDS